LRSGSSASSRPYKRRCPNLDRHLEVPDVITIEAADQRRRRDCRKSRPRSSADKKIFASASSVIRTLADRGCLDDIAALILQGIAVHAAGSACC
jgi:hypothetical protein